MKANKSKKKVNPRPNKFGNFANFSVWALAMLKDVDLAIRTVHVLPCQMKQGSCYEDTQEI